MSRGHRKFPPACPGPRRNTRRPARLMLAAALLPALVGCASGGPTDNPVARKLTWFSYLNGDDLRVRCGKDDADRFRLVFNADYNRHVRTYDVVGDAAAGGAAVEAHVIEATDLARITPLDPLSAARGRTATIHLTAGQFQSFVGRLSDDGAFDPPPEGMRLPSNGFYWLISGCRAGHWFFTAYPYPSQRFTAARFPEAVRRIDPTGVAFPPLPAPADAPRGLPPAGARNEAGVFFQVEVERGGLVGPTAPFGSLLATLFGR